MVAIPLFLTALLSFATGTRFKQNIWSYKLGSLIKRVINKPEYTAELIRKGHAIRDFIGYRNSVSSKSDIDEIIMFLCVQ